MRSETVVVTGASAGLGRAIAREFGRRGARVGLLARGIDGIQAAKREIESMGGKAIILTANIADFNAVEGAAATVEQELARSTSGSTTLWRLCFLR